MGREGLNWRFHSRRQAGYFWGPSNTLILTSAVDAGCLFYYFFSYATIFIHCCRYYVFHNKRKFKRNIDWHDTSTYEVVLSKQAKTIESDWDPRSSYQWVGNTRDSGTWQIMTQGYNQKIPDPSKLYRASNLFSSVKIGKEKKSRREPIDEKKTSSYIKQWQCTM